MGWKEKNRRKRKNKSDDSCGGNETKAPRNGATPENVNTVDTVNTVDNDKISASVSDSIRKANSVLFESSYNMDNSVFDTEDSSSLAESQKSTDGSSNNTVAVSGDQGIVSNNDIMEYLKHMDSKINTMDGRLKTLDTLEQKVCEIDTDLKKLWNFVQDNIKRTDDKVATCIDRVDNLEISLGLAHDKLTQLQKEKDSMQEDMLYVQSQSMRNNLVFTNLPETPHESPVQAEAALRNFMQEKLKLAQDTVDQIRFERVHRMGTYDKDSRFPRRMVAKFVLFKDRETVRKQGKELSGTHYSMYEQFPREIAQRRKNLIPQLKAAKRANKKAWLSYDTLYVDGRAVRVNED